jgi:hypothetical protein
MAETPTTIKDDIDKAAQYCLDALTMLGDKDAVSLKLLIVGAIEQLANKILDDAISDVSFVGNLWGEVARTTSKTVEDITRRMETRRIK